MKKPLFIFLAFCFISTFARTKTDTITNWQTYIDKELLFDGYENIEYPKIGIINLKDNFKQLRFKIFYDFFNDKTNKRIEFIINNKVAKSFVSIADSQSEFKINKNQLYDFLLKNSNKIITLKYYDRINKKGFIIGKLKIKTNVNSR